jgi:beta-N-acetylhexosaminidase
MGALIDKYGVGESCARALAAGSDLILMKAENQWRGEMFYTIEKWVESGKIDSDELDQKVRRILSMKYDYGLFEKMGTVDPAHSDSPYGDPEVLATAREAAERAAMVCRDSLGCLPLDRHARVLLINQQNSVKTPYDSWDHPALFQELLEEGWPTLQTFETSFGLDDDAQEEAVVKFATEGAFDLIICTNFYDRSSKPHRYARTLIDQGLPVLLITNTPYCIAETGGLIPQAPSILLNMNLSPEGLKFTRDMLFGKAEAKGRWPLSNYDPLGLRSAP